MTLDQLSAAATQGTLVYTGRISFEDAQFLYMLAHMYRTSQLAAVADDAIERVAFGMWKAEAERAAPNVAKKRTLEGFADESPDTRSKWLHLATAAAAAMKDTQP